MEQEKFKQWISEYSGCDGGDIGSKESPSTWVCGIEWGEGFDDESFKSHLLKENTSHPPKGFNDWEENISYIFNWQTMKLLSAIDGGDVSDYKYFAEKKKPFVVGEKGFFKMNLYPIAFKDTNDKNWTEIYKTISGFNTKNDYIKFCKENRFPAISSWVEKYTPKLILCFGISYFDDFKKSFCVTCDFNEEYIDGKRLLWAKNKHNGLVIVLPFMINKNGLTKNSSIQSFGKRISQLLKL